MLMCVELMCDGDMKEPRIWRQWRDLTRVPRRLRRLPAAATDAMSTTRWIRIRIRVGTTGQTCQGIRTHRRPQRQEPASLNRFRRLIGYMLGGSILFFLVGWVMISHHYVYLRLLSLSLIQNSRSMRVWCSHDCMLVSRRIVRALDVCRDLIHRRDDTCSH